MNINIRKILSSDRNDYIQMVNSFYNSAAVMHKIPLKYIEDTFDFIQNDDKYASCYIIEHENLIIGYCLISKTYSQEVSGMVLLIEELYIKEEYRSHGIGTKVLNFLKEEYKDYRRIRLEVEKNNLRALKLYTKIGFDNLGYLQMVIEMEEKIYE